LLIHSIAHRTEPLALSTQLAEIRLYEGGRRLSIASAVAIGGDGPADLGAARAVDGNYNTKWADAAVLHGDGNASILELRLHAPARVTSYELVSADDQPSRDPASWTLWGTAAVSTAAAADTTAATADASEWWLLDAQLPYAGRRPGRLSSFGRLPTHGGRAADEAVAFTSWPLCGSPEHLDMPTTAPTLPTTAPNVPTTAPTLPTTAPNVPSPLMLIDELGAASAAPSLGMQTLGTFEGRVAALVPSAAVAAVTLFESAAFDGRRHTLPMTGVPCRLPPSVRPRVRSLRIQLRSDVARLLYPAGAQHGARTDLATGEMQGQATLGRAAAAPTDAAPTGAAPTVAASATPAATARYLDLDEEVPSVADGATALCLGARVSGALLFPQRAYGGSPLILWRRGGQRRGGHARAHADGAPTTAPTAGEVCVHLPRRVQSVRTVGDDGALLLPTDEPADGAALVIRRSFPFATRLEHPTLTLAAASFSSSSSSTTTTATVSSTSSPSSSSSSAASAFESRRIRAVLGSAVVGSAPPAVTVSLKAICLGTSVRSLDVYALARWSGRLESVQGSRGCGGGDDDDDDELEGGTHATHSAHDTTRLIELEVGSVRLRRADDGLDCSSPGILCSSAPRTRDMMLNTTRDREAETLPLHGMLLPFRVPSTAPRGFPPELAAGVHGSFHAYNPSLLARADGSVELVARFSNYNFCQARHTFEANLAAANGALMSYVLRGVLNTTTWQLDERGLEMWSDVNERFPVAQVESVSGPEDPRAIQAAGETYLLVAAWESTKVQWQHLLRVDRGGVDRGGVDTRMDVDPRYTLSLRPWLAQFASGEREQRAREKNWSPFVWRGELFVEYSLEPRLVLAVNRETGEGTPLLPLTSSPAMRAWVDKLGPVSGGTPAVELRDLNVFLALAHVKLFKKKGARTATSKMMYKHFWYAFEAHPPFAILSVSTPFTLPSQLPETPSIQFATGLLYRPAERDLLVAYGEIDCHSSISRFPLHATLDATLGRRRLGPPVPLLTTLVLLGAPSARGADAGGARDGAIGRGAGAVPGASEGSDRRTLDGAVPGTSDGAVPSTSDGAVPGTTNGAVPGTSEWTPLDRLIPILSQLANASGASPSNGAHASHNRRRGRWGGKRGRASDASVGPRVHVLFESACAEGLGAETTRPLSVVGAGYGCLDCAWSMAEVRRDGEALGDWAERMYENLRCHASPPMPSRARIIADVAAHLGAQHDAQHDAQHGAQHDAQHGAQPTEPHALPGAGRGVAATDALRLAICAAICAEGEPLVLCDCALEPQEISLPIHTVGAALRSRLRHARYSLIFYDGTPSGVPGTAPPEVTGTAPPEVPGTAPSEVPGTAPFDDATPSVPGTAHRINLIREHAPSAVRVRLHSGPAVHSGPAAAAGESWAAGMNEKESPSNELDNDDVVLTLTEAVARTLVSAGVAAATPAAGWLIPRLRELALSRGGSRH